MTTLELEHLWHPDGWQSPGSVTLDDGSDAREVVRGYALPGMPNLHSHAFQRAMAGLAERAASPDESFWTWRNVMYGFVEKLGPEEIEAIAAQLFVEMLEAGYTAVGEFHYLHRAPDGSLYDEPAELALRIVSAAERTGIALTLLPVLYQQGGFGGAPLGGSQRRFALSLDELFAIVERVEPHANVGVAPHSLRAVSPDALGEVATRTSGPIHIHVAEQTKEVDDCVAWSGQRPVEWLLAHADVNERWCLVHATHVTAAEVNAVARRRAVIGLCPTTEANLGDGLFPLPELLASGGPWGIGSDSHVSVSATEELRWLEYGQRLALRRRNVAPSGDALWAAALAGGTRALGGVPRADFVVLDPEHPALVERPLDRIVDAFVFAAGRSAIRDVMAGGRWVVRDGRHVARDAVRSAYGKALRRLR